MKSFQLSVFHYNFFHLFFFFDQNFTAVRKQHWLEWKKNRSVYFFLSSSIFITSSPYSNTLFSTLWFVSHFNQRIPTLLYFVSTLCILYWSLIVACQVSWGVLPTQPKWPNTSCLTSVWNSTHETRSCGWSYVLQTL